MIGQTIGHYLVTEKIGEGGMGIVYRAHDQRLNRDVALKVLPPGKLEDDAPRKRFRKEALALAKLNHPNIGTVYDFDTQGDVDFLVMEFIPGETLGQRLAKGSLSEKELIPLALQIAAALEEAHEHGIVHQDLKPGNIMVTPKGQVKVLDFGLARLLDANGGTEITQTVPQTDGAGTLPYMSPEQLRSEIVDARSDIFAAGVVLYEMTAGHRPFREKQSARLMQQILNDRPRPLSEWNPRISPQLEGLILKALDKQPDLRYQSARELRVDLERLAAQQLPSSATSVTRPPSTRSWTQMLRTHPRAIYLSGLVLGITAITLWWLASAHPVLSFAPRDWLLITDFDNQTGDALFDRSLLTALTVSLEQSPHANVVPRPRIVDSLHRMGKTGDERITNELAREISQREAIRAILSCSISRVGQQYALTARLIDPQSGMAVRSYIEQAKDQDHVLDALGSVATRVRRDLGESMLATNKADRPLPMVTTRSMQALKMFADGGESWSKARYSAAVQLFESAVKADPDFAMAHAALGSAYYSHIFNRPVEGKEHIEKALELSEHTTDRERLYIQTRYAQDLGHVTEAANRFDEYLTNYPDDWGMRSNYASLLRSNGREEDAIKQYREILRLSSQYPATYIDLATCYSSLGKNAEALRNYEEAFKLDPSWKTNQNINHEYGMALFRSGDEAKARETFKLAFAQPDLKPRGLRSLAWLDLYHGKYADAKPRLQEALLTDEAYKWSLSILREHNLLAIVADGQGDQAGRLRQLDLALAYLANAGIVVRAGLWLGIPYAQSGNVTKASEILDKAKPKADPKNPEQVSDLQVLEGEIELARGNHDRAIELFSLADRSKRSAMTIGGLARAYEAAGDSGQAIVWYELVIGQAEPPVGWEPQQDWLAAHFRVARLYFAKGEKTKAAAQLNWLLEAWKDADSELPLLKDALRLKKEMDSNP